MQLMQHPLGSRCNFFISSLVSRRRVHATFNESFGITSRKLHSFFNPSASVKLSPRTKFRYKFLEILTGRSSLVRQRSFSSSTICESASRWYRSKNEALRRMRSQSLRNKIPSFYKGSRLWLYIDRIPQSVILWGILGINTFLFLVWQYAAERRDYSLLKVMQENLLLSWHNLKEGRFWTLITPAFSHSATNHFFFNAMTFYFISPPVLQILGNTAFLTLYLTGGLICSTFSLLVNQVIRNRNGASQGASGAIFAVTSFFACVMPKATFLVFFVIPAPAWLLVSSLFAWDLVSTITDRRTTTDGAGHIGGMLVGVVYYFLRRRRFG